MHAKRVKLYENNYLIRKNKKTRSSKVSSNRVITFASLFLFLIVLSGAAYALSLVAQYSVHLPSVNTPFERRLPESTIIYDKKGGILYTVYDSENRIFTPLAQIPNEMRFAMLAAEDINFYKEDGINIQAIFRSFVHDVFSSSDSGLQGASTITQQLIKYTSLNDSRTIERKIREILLTLKVTKAYSKNQILEAYLNAVPFGGSNYGIETASLAYFNKDVSKLDLAQSAFLAGLPQAPSIYAPQFLNGRYTISNASLARQHYVLKQMQKYKSITQVTDEQIQAAENETLVFESNQSIKYPSFVFYIRSLLYDTYGKDAINNGGMRVYTTLDPKIQDLAQEAVQKGVSNNLSIGQNAHNASLVALDATNGNILAMVGSVNYYDISKQVSGSVNMTTASISPASSIKPFLYLQAFAASGINPDTHVQDERFCYQIKGQQDYCPLDFDFRFYGDMTVNTALLLSRNAPAIQIANKLGYRAVYENFSRLGIIPTDSMNNYNLSIAIGGYDEDTLLAHTAAYTLLSQDGIKKTARGVTQINDKYNNIYTSPPIRNDRLFADDKVRQINSILKNYHTLQSLKDKGMHVAGKTGTATDNKNNLFMGYTSHLAIGVWAGNTDKSFTSATTYGETAAAPIFNDVLSQIYSQFTETDNF